MYRFRILQNGAEEMYIKCFVRSTVFELRFRPKRYFYILRNMTLLPHNTYDDLKYVFAGYAETNDKLKFEKGG